MPLLRRFMLVCLASLACLLPLSLWAQTASTITSVVVFGDSLSDTGNIANLTQSQYKIRYPADNPTLGFDYTDGRFTDGTDTQPAASTAYKGVWIEQLAAVYGLTVKDSLDGGTNYAYGDATTGGGTTTETRTYLGVPISITLQNMGQQVTTYLATNPTPNASTLYVLWGGSNDLLGAASAGQDPVAAAQTAVTNELALVQQLMAKGATTFLIPNVPPLGAFAAAQGPAAVAALNKASAVFAQGLAAGITQLQQAAMGSTLKIYPADVFTSFGTIAASPMMFGFGDITTAADTVTASPDTYLIWDGLHPTTSGHHWAAVAAAATLHPPVVGGFTLNAPAAVLAGQSVTVTAVATSAVKVTPSGLVTLFNGTSVVGSAAMDATGTATITFTSPAAASSLALTAVYMGDLSNGSAVSKVTTVPLLNAAVGTMTVVISSSATANPGAAVTFTATVTPVSASYGAPTGTVTFQDRTSTLGTGTLSNGVATYVTSALAAGTHQITASYAAAGVFGGSTSAAITETIVAPGFTASANPASLTIASGASGTSTLTVAFAGGYTGTVTPACGTLPAHFSCSIVPIVPLPTANPVSTSSSYTLTIATNAATTTAAIDDSGRPGAWQDARTWSAGLLLPGTLGLISFSRRRKRLRGLLQMSLAMLFCAGLLGLSGCGGSANNNAAAGTYTVPVIFTPSVTTGGVAAQTVNISVTVQ